MGYFREIGGHPVYFPGIDPEPGATAAFHEKRNATLQAKFLPDSEVRKTTGDIDADLPLKPGYDERAKHFYARKFKPKEVEAINYYTGGGYSRMNEVLRSMGGGESPEALAGLDDPAAKRAVALQRVIDRSPPTKEARILTRFQATDPKLEAGGQYRAAGFVSTSDIGQYAFLPKQGAIAFEISVPKGSKGVLEGVNSAELETILGHNSKFRVVGVKDLKYDTGNATSRVVKTYQMEYLSP